MRIVIRGIVHKIDQKVAHGRICACRKVLERRSICFPPFIPGTLNVKLEKEFLLPDWANVIHISRNELHRADPGFEPEWWKLLPIEAINQKSIPAFILRPEKTCHELDTVEIIGHEIPLEDGAEIEITLLDTLHNAL